MVKQSTKEIYSKDQALLQCMLRVGNSKDELKGVIMDLDHLSRTIKSLTATAHFPRDKAEVFYGVIARMGSIVKDLEGAENIASDQIEKS